MTEKQILEEIERYINDKVYNYAILINGEWGSGKTYFVKNSLKNAIESNNENNTFEKKSLKYISLYGCKDTEELQEKIIWELVEDFSSRLTKKNVLKRYPKQTHTNVVTSVRKISSGLLQKFFPTMSVYDLSWNWFNFESYIFIFDDLERCSCPLNEIFGFINDLVEHAGAKVIIVANEKEISHHIISRNIEQQYLISSNNEIDWPKYEKSNNLFPRLYNPASTGNKISLEELDFRRSTLFPAEESNAEYKKFREKLIGVTLEYESDTEEIVKSLIDKSNYDSKIKNALKNQLNDLISKMDFYRHHNLRTVQFFLSKVSHLLMEFEKMNVDEDFYVRTQKYIISECFDYSIKFKGNYKEPTDTLKYLYSEEKYNSKTIKAFVENGKYDFETYHNEINNIIETEFKNVIDSEDPYNKLYGGYYYLSQVECEEKFEELKNRLSKNLYPTSIYEKILILTAQLELIGFPHSNTEYIIRCMINNIEAIPGEKILKLDLFFLNDPKIRDKVTKYAQQINDELVLKIHNRERKSMKDILKSDNWVDSLEKIIRPGEERYALDIPVFSQADPSDWITAIISSTSKTIHDFRSWMWSLYPQNFKKNSFSEDWPTMEKIHDGIIPIEENDLIKRQALEYVIWQIEETFKINTDQEYNSSKPTDD